MRWPGVAGARGLLAPSLVTLVLASGCTPDRAPSVAGPPVILISVDTLRADALHDEGGRTPAFDALAADGVDFDHAAAPMPFTLTSHMTLLTGLAPDVHGVFDEADRLPQGVETLATILSRAGYGTAAVVSSDWLAPAFGFGRGFDEYREIDLELTFASRVTRAALAALDRVIDDGRAPFLFVHYYDAHSDFESDGNERPYYASIEATSSLPPGCEEGLCAPDGSCATGFLLWATRNPTAVSGETRECLQAAYQAGVRDLDSGLSEFLAALRDRGLYDRAVIVLTSDHGEEFGEHGQFIHAQTFGESLDVPLLVKLPDGERASTVESAPSELADVLPTILGELGLALPSGTTGSDLLAPSRSLDRIRLAQNKYRKERYSLTLGTWRLIHDYVTAQSSLYDTDADPGELLDLAADEEERVTQLRTLLDARLRRNRQLAVALAGEDERGAQVLDEAAKRRLEALGYID